MSGRCQVCSASTTWDDDVGSAVCTSCGSLDDPSQSVLTSSFYDYHNRTSELSLWDSTATTTLKSLRAGNNWDLAGQGKESRDRKNSYAISEFIKSLAVSLNATGLSPRAIALFNQVKSANQFRWGQKSKLVAAACLAIALRESNRPDSLRDIASILDAPPTSIIREFTSITSTLNLNLSLVDPSVYMSTLQGHLASALQEPHSSSLPSTVAKPLHALCLRSITKTATSLCQILPRLSPEHNILHLPAAPTACGIYLLSIEAETRSVLDSLGDLAEYLATRCHSSKSVVMARYKSVQDEVACWAEQVPWLDRYEKKGGRAKISKRLIAARSLKDVILFQEGIWEQKAKLSLDLDFSEDDDKKPNSSQRTLHSSLIKPSSAMSHATQFLLDPVGTSITSIKKTPTSTFVSHLPLASRVLTNPSEFTVYQRLTRLQLLALERGGVTAEHISDEDLFADGEFERILRSDDEVTALRKTFGWTKDDGDKGNEEGLPTTKGQPPIQRKRKQLVLEDKIIRGTALSPRKKSRLNMEAFTKLMATDNDDDDDDGSLSNQNDDLEPRTLGLFGFINDFNDHACSAHDLGPRTGDDSEGHITYVTLSSPPQHHPQASKSLLNENGAVVIQEWRPPSPQHTATDSRYEEERPP